VAGASASGCWPSLKQSEVQQCCSNTLTMTGSHLPDCARSKHTFYGIESHRCMEATPSLACANK
jgi:hypothetical protein